MKNLLLFFLPLFYFLPFFSLAQIQLETLACNKLSAKLYQDDIGYKEYSYWLEKQIIPNVWSQKQKKQGFKDDVIFDSLEKGIYRITYVIRNWSKERNLQMKSLASTKIVSNSIEIWNCLESNSKQTKTKNNEKNFLIFPNPTKDVLHIILNDFDPEVDTKIVVHDFLGKFILTEKIIQTNQKIDVSFFNAGTYYIQVMKNSKSMYYEKFILLTK